ncbi:hypothetical protein CRE_14247 [Caenorhabditis remanei]|uniref:60S ribosomal export protein NMD3 n=1 Tax=Caenorhabditis remanei TaxID=31234 RepID=E3N7L8_CAERE|nr:hypothetical protein CRE_14247 [Caenorhabditis remanei]
MPQNMYGATPSTTGAPPGAPGPHYVAHQATGGSFPAPQVPEDSMTIGEGCAHGGDSGAVKFEFAHSLSLLVFFNHFELMLGAQRHPATYRTQIVLCDVNPESLCHLTRVTGWELFSNQLEPFVKKIIEFAIDGFLNLPQETQIHLLKGSVFELCLIFAPMYHYKDTQVVCGERETPFRSPVVSLRTLLRFVRCTAECVDESRTRVKGTSVDLSQKIEANAHKIPKKMQSLEMKQTVGLMACCEYGVAIEPNPANMCSGCLRSRVDITEGIQRSCTIYMCKFCDRYFVPPSAWMRAELESRELLSICLKKLKPMLTKVRLTDACFVWSEAHSKHIKVKITIQKEVFTNTILQQAVVVEFTVHSQENKREMTGNYHHVYTM